MGKVVEKKYPQRRGMSLLQKASVPKLNLLQGIVTKESKVYICTFCKLANIAS